MAYSQIDQDYCSDVHGGVKPFIILRIELPYFCMTIIVFHETPDISRHLKGNTNVRLCLSVSRRGDTYVFENLGHLSAHTFTNHKKDLFAGAPSEINQSSVGLGVELHQSSNLLNLV